MMLIFLLIFFQPKGEKNKGEIEEASVALRRVSPCLIIFKINLILIFSVVRICCELINSRGYYEIIFILFVFGCD